MKYLFFLAIALAASSTCLYSQTTHLYVIKPTGTYEVTSNYSVSVMPNGETHYDFAELPIIVPYLPDPPLDRTKMACGFAAPGTEIACGPFNEYHQPQGSWTWTCSNTNTWRCSTKSGNTTTINTDCNN